jgi:hypothetical protein
MTRWVLEGHHPNQSQLLRFPMKYPQSKRPIPPHAIAQKTQTLLVEAF